MRHAGLLLGAPAAAALLLLAAGALSDPSAPAGDAGESSVYAFTADRIDGKPQRLDAYRDRVLLVVNVASRCGFTPQYEGLEALFQRYRERGFAILGFPSNDFKAQGPGSNEEIAEFCRMNYGVEFPMFAKIRVLGEEAHPLYRYLTGLPEPLGGAVQWNFQKYLVDRHGRVVEKFSPRTEPDAPELTVAIERLLGEDA